MTEAFEASRAQMKYAELLLRKGMQEEARALLRELARREPPHAPACYLLGVLRGEDGAPEEAAELLSRALAVEPGNAKTLNALGAVLQRLGEPGHAEACYREALRAAPPFEEARVNLALLLVEAVRLSEAEALLAEGVRLHPLSVRLAYNLANVLQYQGRSLDAVEGYRAVLRLDPDHLDARQNLLFALHYAPQFTRRLIYAEHLKGARRPPFRPGCGVGRPPRPPGGRIRIGYLSPDFREHAVASFIEPVLREHDRFRFEIFCYANVSRPDATTGRLEGLSERWRDIYGVPDREAAALVAGDGIDVLVDLAGHTSGNRLPLFALRPAPLQVTWIGYPDTTGMKEIDFRLTDPLVDPPGEEDRYHSEELIRLPRTFCCWLPPREAPPLAPPPCLLSGEVTFGSFNNLAKVTPEVIALWSRVLNAVPGSRLFVKAKPLADEGVRRRILEGFCAHGVPPQRIELDPGQPALAEHLAQYRRVDIALDTFPYNGTTTTCEALWMGVPVVTLTGDRHASRTGATLLAACDLEDLVARDAEQYLELAVEVARDTATLARFREGARERLARSPLLDAAGVTREWEAVLEGMVAAGDGGTGYPQNAR